MLEVQDFLVKGRKLQFKGQNVVSKPAVAAESSGFGVNKLASLVQAEKQLISENSRLLNLMRRRLGDKNMSFVYDESMAEDVSKFLTDGGFKKVDIVTDELDKLDGDKLLVYGKAWVVGGGIVVQILCAVAWVAFF